MVPPGIFIPWLEMEPCFFELGNWIIEQALTDGMEIRKIRPDFVVNVNISATQLENHGFRQAVVDILKKTKFPQGSDDAKDTYVTIRETGSAAESQVR